MHRRDFLHRLVLAAGAAGLASHGCWLAAANAGSWFRDFHAALAEKPWLAGWANLDRDVLPEQSLRWQGKLPKGLAGTLYRNGPARFERAGIRYHHWFDGDGLVQAWRIGDGTVSHRARMVGTSKFLAENAVGRFIRQTPGTWIDDAETMRNSDDINVANTSMLHHAGQLHALWEGGSAWTLDPDTLHSRGAKTWREDLVALPFSAHPLRDADGSLWNFGLAAYASSPTLLLWRIDTDGDPISVTPIELTLPGYLHSFAMTRRYLVFIIGPWLYDREGSGAFFERMRWRPEQGSEAIIVDKNHPEKPIRRSLPGGLAFHYGNAGERNGRIVMHACWYDDLDRTNRGLMDLMCGRTRQPASKNQDPLVRIEIPVIGVADASLTRPGPASTEFPAWDARFDDMDGRLYLAAQTDLSAPFLDGIMSWDPRRERIDRFHYGSGWLVEEHLFVPDRDRAGRDKGWLIGTALDYERQRSCLSIFDAGRLADGPICQAALPRPLPLGFHGIFLPR